MPRPIRSSVLRLITAVPVAALLVALAVAGSLPGPDLTVRAQAPAVVVDVDLPSEAAGPVGTLALRLFAPPDVAAARFPDGAPVVVVAPGGTGTGSLRPVLPLASDLVRVVFLLPGGVDEAAGRHSDGQPDYRGPASIAALRDVLLFAAGRRADAGGRTIDDLVPVPVRHENVGLLGMSNGGNIATAVAATHGPDLAGHLRYIVQWESPISSQAATVDLSGSRLICPDPQPPLRFPVTNPRYRAYGPLELDVDLADLASDTAAPEARVFHDGNGDGIFTTVVDPFNGCRTPDLDLDGRLTVDEDWPLGAFTDGVVAVYSRPVSRALADQDVFGGAWPRGIMPAAAAERWWDARESVRHYAAAWAALPGLEGMVLASTIDHVQHVPGHPHIRQAFEGWDGVGAWVRLNPGAGYMAQADPRLAGRSDLPPNRPNTPPDDWLDAATWAVPEDIPDDVTQAAAVWQMVDRAESRPLPGSPTPPRPTPPSPTPTATGEPSATPEPALRVLMPLVLAGAEPAR